MIDFDAPTVVRAWTVDRLRALGWTHEVPKGLPPEGRQIAERAWTGATYCFECSAMRERARAKRA